MKHALAVIAVLLLAGSLTAQSTDETIEQPVAKISDQPTAAPSEDPQPIRFAMESSFDFGSMRLEEAATLSFKEFLFAEISLGLPFADIARLFSPTEAQDEILYSKRYYDLSPELRLDIGYRWLPLYWLGLDAGAGMSVFMRAQKYYYRAPVMDLDQEQTSVHWIFEPSAFVSAKLLYGRWIKREAFNGLNASLGFRLPLRDAFYMLGRYRFIISLGWEY
jgi:hypothetical protein